MTNLLRVVSALFVAKNGPYFGLDAVDPWDEDRDARMYQGPHPVVAHPPCQRWGKFWAGSPLAISRGAERKTLGDDDGCFASALASVRRWGGVLEHPEGSYDWAHFGLNKPPRIGGWVRADDYGGWTCRVEQGRYGHYARKPTWLYLVGCNLPDIDWGISEPKFPAWAIQKHGLAYCKRAGEVSFKGGGTNSKHRIYTPVLFRDLLIEMARSAQ